MIPERKVVKQTLLGDRRRWGSTTQECEGKAYLAHTCSGGLHLNEVLYTRNDFKHLKPLQKRYFWHVYNSTINCAWFHVEYGHSTNFRKWFQDRISRIYGGDEIANYVGNAPLTINRSRGGPVNETE